MRLENFNEAFERMGNMPLNEAAENTPAKKYEILKGSFGKLTQLKNLAVKNLSSMDIGDDFVKYENSVKILDWILRLGHALRELPSENDNDFSLKIKWADKYMKQIADSLKTGQPVHESLLKESLNYLEK